MRGDLSEKPAADVCRALAVAAASGVLEIEGPDGRGSIVYRAGDVIAATSPTPHARLGDRLVNAGLVEERDLEQVLRSPARSGPHQRLGAVLVEHGLVGRDAVRLVAQEQVIDAVFDVLRWRYGGYRFEPGDATGVDEVPLRIPVDQLMVEVARRQREWAELERVIPDLDAVPRFRTGTGTAAASLEPDEFTVLASIDGVRSVRELADDLGYGRFEAARIVYGLTLLGIVEVMLPEDEVGRALEEALHSLALADTQGFADDDGVTDDDERLADAGEGATPADLDERSDPADVDGSPDPPVTDGSSDPGDTDEGSVDRIHPDEVDIDPPGTVEPGLDGPSPGLVRPDPAAEPPPAPPQPSPALVDVARLLAELQDEPGDADPQAPDPAARTVEDDRPERATQQPADPATTPDPSDPDTTSPPSQAPHPDTTTRDPSDPVTTAPPAGTDAHAPGDDEPPDAAGPAPLDSREVSELLRELSRLALEEPSDTGGPPPPRRGPPREDPPPRPSPPPSSPPKRRRLFGRG